METPKNYEGRLTDKIMMAIEEHIKKDPPPQENHHYNRAWSKILDILTKENKDSPEPEKEG